MRLKTLMAGWLAASVIVGVAFTGGCAATEAEAPVPPPPPTQIIENIAPQEALALIQANQRNPNFTIIDVRTQEEFDLEHIENAVNLNYSPQTFRDDIDKLDKSQTYLIYCSDGGRSRIALSIMKELGFSEVYRISGGIDQWLAAELPTIQPTPAWKIESIAPQEALALTLENKNNPDFVIIDARTLKEFAVSHIENAIHLDYTSDTFQDELDKLDKNKVYLIYCAVSACNESALNVMEELGFKEVYNMSGGINQWEAEGFPVIKGTPSQTSNTILPQDAFALIQENQDTPDFKIVDLRTPSEFASGHLKNAINIDYHATTFEEELMGLDRDKTYLIYYDCACGNVSKNTAVMMDTLDFKEVYDMRSGSDQWIQEGLPTVQ